MKKEYSIRVPVHSTPLDHLGRVQRDEDIKIIVYGGVPDSPLNGGRFNTALNGFVVKDRFLLSITKEQLARATACFFAAMEEANRQHLSFYLAFTNLFISPEELNARNLEPLDRLVECGDRYGVKNGLILANQLLEDHIRRKYGGRLTYSSSCTKYVSPQRILTPRETLAMYLEDSAKYDYVCVTPQDSRREAQLRAVLKDSKCGIIAISNSYCAFNCNSYYHYRDMSRKNKKSVVDIGTVELLADALAFMLPRLTTCTAMRHSFCKLETDEIAAMQLKAGIVNFKLGRGIGARSVDLLVDLIRKARTGQP